jgi:hypothetical protein
MSQSGQQGTGELASNQSSASNHCSHLGHCPSIRVPLARVTEPPAARRGSVIGPPAVDGRAAPMSSAVRCLPRGPGPENLRSAPGLLDEEVDSTQRRPPPTHGVQRVSARGAGPSKAPTASSTPRSGVARWGSPVRCGRMPIRLPTDARMTPAPGTGRARGPNRGYDAFTGMRWGLASSALGTVMWSNPSSYVARMSSAFTFDGSRKAR